MPTNDFKAIASSIGANVQPQADFAAYVELLNNGFPTGVVDSKVFNKAWRQSSFIAATLAQFIADRTGQDVLDNGDMVALEKLLMSAICIEYPTGGATGAFTLTPGPAITAYAAGQRYNVKFSAAGNGSDTINVSGLGAKNLKQYAPSGAKVAPTITNGLLATIEYDGVDWVILNPALKGLSFNGIKPISAAGNLDGSNVGALTVFSGTTFAVNVPAANSVPPGSTLSFASIASGTVTLNRSGADNFTSRGANLTSLTVNANDSLQLTSDGASVWYATGAAVAAFGIGQSYGDFTASRAINTTYTNTTNKPIFVSVAVVGNVATGTVSIGMTVNGFTQIGSVSLITGSTPSNTQISASAIVPPGATYSAAVTQGTLLKWVELR